MLFLWPVFIFFIPVILFYDSALVLFHLPLLLMVYFSFNIARAHIQFLFFPLSVFTAYYTTEPSNFLELPYFITFQLLTLFYYWYYWLLSCIAKYRLIFSLPYTYSFHGVCYPEFLFSFTSELTQISKSSTNAHISQFINCKFLYILHSSCCTPSVVEKASEVMFY